MGRRLQRIGAVAIKNSVYVLPATEQATEDFQWILHEISDGGGEASLCQAEFVDGLTDREIEGLFRQARSRDYNNIAEEAKAMLKALAAEGHTTTERRSDLEAGLAKLRKRFRAIARIDFFETEHRRHAAEMLEQIEVCLRPRAAEPSAPHAASGVEQLSGCTWVTREGVFVDRIASAWLIRRFIDPAAQFKFVAPHGYRVRPGELRFDMFGAEYTHEGDRCTFETLLGRFRLEDPALAAIAEIVHDIDLKDGKFDREDAAGIERVLAGIAAAYPDDAARLERGGQLFDELHALLKRDAEAATPRVE